MRAMLSAIYTRSGRRYSVDGLWEYVTLPSGHVRAVLRATGQGREYTELRYARRATCPQPDGTASAIQVELQREDAEALARPCQGCQGAAEALVDTVNGPQPACGACVPVARERGYRVRTFVTCTETV